MRTCVHSGRDVLIHEIQQDELPVEGRPQTGGMLAHSAWKHLPLHPLLGPRHFCGQILRGTCLVTAREWSSCSAAGRGSTQASALAKGLVAEAFDWPTAATHSVRKLTPGADRANRGEPLIDRNLPWPSICIRTTCLTG
jgi:hypothetical protein